MKEFRMVGARLTMRAVAIVSVAACAVSWANAQDRYPSRTTEIVVPFSAGGGTDLVARMLADGLNKRLGQPFIVVNRPGGNTNTGTQVVVKAAPDGYTLAMASVGLTANSSLYKKLPFDPQADLAPISLLVNSPAVLTVHPSVPVKTLPELIAYLKARPGELNYASYGVGSGTHLAAEMFQAMTGTKLVHIPYTGGGTAAVGLMSNQVQLMFSGFLPVLGMIQSGTVRPIAYASDRRSPLLPEIPTFAESGLDFKTGTWFGLLAPAKTPEPIIAALHKAAVETLQEQAFRDKITEQGAEVVANTPAEFRAFLKDETERLSAVIRNANVRLD